MLSKKAIRPIIFILILQVFLYSCAPSENKSYINAADIYKKLEDYNSEIILLDYRMFVLPAYIEAFRKNPELYQIQFDAAEGTILSLIDEQETLHAEALEYMNSIENEKIDLSTINNIVDLQSEAMLSYQNAYEAIYEYSENVDGAFNAYTQMHTLASQNAKTAKDLCKSGYDKFIKLSKE